MVGKLPIIKDKPYFTDGRGNINIYDNTNVEALYGAK